MSRHKPSGEALRSLLTVGHPGSDQGPLTPSEPIASTPMRLSIEEIDYYDHNPRRSRNPHYDEIKDSIRAQGMRQPLVVTRRPGAERFMLQFGGNTRLTILRELFAETGEARYQSVDCQFVPWTDEADVLVGHLIENETRGDLLFIEKARAVREAALLLKGPQGEMPSQRELVEVLRQRGYQINQPKVGYYDYTLDVLADALPLAFQAGMGRPQVIRIRALDAAAQKVWRQRELGSTESYRSVFTSALAGTDDAQWTYERARRSIEASIATLADVEIRLIALELGAELDGAAVNDRDEASAVAEAPSAADNAEPTTESATPEAESGRDAPPPLRAPTWEPSTIKVANKPAAPKATSTGNPDRSPTERVASRAPSTAAPATGTAQDEDLDEVPSSKAGDAHADSVRAPAEALPPALAPAVPPIDLSDPDAVLLQRLQLMGRLRQCGQIYARHAGLESCVRLDRHPRITMGYVVCDFPDVERCSRANSDERERQFLAWCWWTLALCSDLFLLNEHLADRYRNPAEAERVRAQLYGSNSRFVSAWRDLSTVSTAIRQTVGSADPFGYSDYVDAASADLWAADLALRNAYWELRAFGARAGIDVVVDPIDPNQ